MTTMITATAWGNKRSLYTHTTAGKAQHNITIDVPI